MGTSQFLSMTIFRISSLAETLTHIDTTKAHVGRITLLSIEEELVAWYVSLAVSNNMDIGSLNDAVTSEMYFLACRIYPRKVLDPSTPDEDATVQDLVWKFIVCQPAVALIRLTNRYPSPRASNVSSIALIIASNYFQYFIDHNDCSHVLPLFSHS